jgi:hypothetical protein
MLSIDMNLPPLCQVSTFLVFSVALLAFGLVSGCQRCHEYFQLVKRKNLATWKHQIVVRVKK